MDTTKTITHLGLCAGYGGIELGLKRIIPTLRSVALCEIEAFAIANLVAKMEAGLMDPAPVWTDLKTFPWAEFRDRVDILTGGYPCQPFSAAGKRLGTDDPRHLWPFIASGIRILRPKLCFFENVEGHISLGLREVIGELEQMGYKVSWGIFSASEVSAPHQRKRVFILAYDQSVGIQGCGAGWLQEPRPHAGQALPVRSGDAGGGELVNACHGSNPAHGYAEAHRLPSEHWQEICAGFSGGANATVWPSRPGEPQHAWEPPRVVSQEGRPVEHASNWSNGEQPTEQQRRHSFSGSSEEGAMGNAECLRISASREHGAMDEASGIPTDREGSESAQTDPESSATRKREGHWADASKCGEIKCEMGRDADEPTTWMDLSELSSLCDSELDEICEWMVKTDNRTDELRLLGNGVVPATAERAFLTLWEEINK